MTRTLAPAGSTRIGYEVANALGRLYQLRPRLAAECDTYTSFARCVRSYLNDLDLYCQHYRTSPHGLRVDTWLDGDLVRQRVTDHNAPTLQLSEYGMRDPAAFLLRRVKRLADLLDHQPILDGADDLVRCVAVWCQVNHVDPHHVTPTAIAGGGMRYIVHTLENDG